MSKYVIAFMAIVVCSIAFGKPVKDISYKGSQAVFVDFTEAEYRITYDIKNKRAFANTTIKFIQDKAGYPIYDLVPRGSWITVDGVSYTEQDVMAPNDVTQYKTISGELKAGTHTMTIYNDIEEDLTFSHGGVQAAFWMADLTDRKFLEMYLPANLEYDRYKITLQIEFRNGTADQKFYTNGKVKYLSKNKYQITFPDYFTASSLYYHTSTVGRFYEKKFVYKSKSGNSIPVTIYSSTSSNVQKAYTETLSVMKELEKNFGTWAHPSLLIYVAGSGGMEYCGATITSLRSLGHELTHSYYARGVMPKDGNAGWIDEAIASWRGNKYESVTKPNFTSSNMAGHSTYQRSTDRQAYTKGANFMAYLNHRLKNQGGLQTFLTKFFEQYKFTQITTPLFRKELEKYTGQNYLPEFERYIYGVGLESDFHSDQVDENPHHPKLTKQQLKALL